MSPIRTPIRALLLLTLAAIAAHGQTPDTAPAAPAPARKTAHPKAPQSLYNPNLILLDPGHGGTDTGAKLSSGGDSPGLEKDATIAFAGRLKTLLTARGFTVLLTHEAASDQLSPDQRAEAANRTRAVACILLHASNGGHGVHLFTSSLPFSFRSTDPDDPAPVLAWNSAQTASLEQSTRLASALSDALYAIRVPLVIGHVSVPPIDSMTCPAIAVELAPIATSADDDTPVLASDAAYQQRIATALTAGLGNWRTYIQGRNAAAAITSGAPAATAPKPAAPPTPRKPPPPRPIPVETPIVPDPAVPGAGAPPQ